MAVVVFLAGQAAGQAQDQVVVEMDDGDSRQVEQVEIPLDSLEGLAIISSGPIAVIGEDEGGLVSSLQRLVKSGTRAVAHEVTAGFRLLSSVKDKWAVLSLQATSLRSVFRLTLPRSLVRLRVKSQEGEVEVSNFAGSVEAETGGGHIRMDRIEGGVHVRTGGGEIQLGEIGTEASAYSAGGSIEARSVAGPASLETGGGDIRLDSVRGPLRASTSGGNISVGKAAGPVSAATGQGVIQLREVKGTVSAQTRDGSIKIGKASGVQAFSASGTIYLVGSQGPLKASTAAGDIVAKIPASAKLEDSDLYTESGDITIYLAPQVTVTIQASCAGAPKAGRIVSEFREIPVQPRGNPGSGLTQAAGRLHGGGPLLRLTARSGNIYLRRSN